MVDTDLGDIEQYILKQNEPVFFGLIFILTNLAVSIEKGRKIVYNMYKYTKPKPKGMLENEKNCDNS